MRWSPFSLRQKSEDAITSVPELRLAAEKIGNALLQGTHAQKQSGGQEKFWQFREYHETDRPQDIDWRQSAKTDRVFVREKELQTPQSVTFWCNRSPSMDFQSNAARRSKQDTARILSLALGLMFQRGDEMIGYLGESRRSRSDAALQRLAERLLDYDEATLPHGQISSHTTFIGVGDFLEPLDTISEQLDAIAGRTRSGLLVHVLDPAEIELPYTGHIVFEGLQKTEHKVDNVVGIRSAYEGRVKAHIEGLYDLAHTYGWHYVLHRTDGDLETTLFDIWSMMGGRE